VDNTLGFAAAYQAFTHNPDTNQNTLAATTPDTREEPCDCDVYSKGVFLGLSVRFPAKPKIKEEKPPVSVTYALSVKAKDKFTKEILPNTEIALKDANGITVLTGKTNEKGVLLLENVLPDDYTIEGALNKVKLEPTPTKKSEFIANKTLEKEIIYSDSNIILKGVAVICETTKPISGVTVILKKSTGVVENIAVTDSIGQFSFPIKPQTEYSIYGKKATYFSQIVNIASQQYDRNVTLYVKVDLCLEETDCEKAIKLKNILYDLDKYFIREESKKELNRLVQFMVDNPDVKVEVSSHTDCRASNNYNQTLSQNRANAAVDYMVSQGIVRERLKGVGYGESKLLNECADGIPCTEEQHQLNRRTEMKVICPQKK
jgi:outer membrane protein OmpA-like peptidoglycan-associated protein